MPFISQINYSDAIQGRIKKRPTHHPLASWLLANGAKYEGSNQFVDPELSLTEDHFENILKIIDSARRQGHSGVEIRLTPESLSAIQSQIAAISALENVDVESQFYGKCLKREQILVRFREEKATWLLDLAKRTLSSDEFAELERLINARIMRSEREAFLTKKAIISNTLGIK